MAAEVVQRRFPSGIARSVRGLFFAAVSVPAYPALAGLLIASAVFQPKALSLPFLLIVLRQAVPLGLVAIGQSLTVIGRSIDLSVGGVIALVNVLLAHRLFAAGAPWMSLAMPVLLGTAVGAANAFFIARLRASAVIITLGVSIVLIGLSYVVSGGAPGGQVQPVVRWLATGRLGLFPIAAFVWLAVAALVAFTLAKLVIGRELQALGANYFAARLGGLPVGKTLVFAHVASGAIAGIAGIVLTGYIGTGTLNLGSDLVLASLAAVVLGGTSFGSGRGGVLGVIAGALVITYLGNLLRGMGVAQPMQLVIQGLIVAGAAGLAAHRRR
ncbi:hypothetical protein C3941_20465 [Kaistia algarum]|uniref:ABC transporter permease n=1 Tax=Kaistia algarum TaxID=2083279 RepID=UPI000CE8FB65|nr:ABC transporter permease [Kaistia algarum]MCX5513974.1 ABC transporter permease [Kaistia algarum]PPE78057.1 hypothetical protein C3941_20465 [Kaistia algarum]